MARPESAATDEVLAALGYAGSRSCLRGRELAHAQSYGHIFRRARTHAGLDAVYCLRPFETTERASRSGIIPVTYVCGAGSIEEADDIHRLVWNQNVVPLLVVLTPTGVRLYTGFEHPSTARGDRSSLLVESALSDATRRLEAVSARAIDSGEVWDTFADRIRPRHRVEWRLLQNLEDLQAMLLQEETQDSTLVHALIGKLLYIYYLRHWEILSDTRLDQWGLTWKEVAGRSTTAPAFGRLCDKLNSWLNGSIFPIEPNALQGSGERLLQRITGAFAGDAPSGQLHLDFQAYDFSFIPIETLSVVYEQFLQQRPTIEGSNVRRELSAYYTPIPVVDFMIDRMDEQRPLRPGTRVLDPSCGSGAFLVQCYRRLVEDRLHTTPDGRLAPAQLRDLLVTHIHGIDVDGEACRMAELSLILTMLDYIDPPDLTTMEFKLPRLSERNIIEANAFDDSHAFVAAAMETGFDWIIGNPPWKDIIGLTLDGVQG